MTLRLRLVLGLAAVAALLAAPLWVAFDALGSAAETAHALRTQDVDASLLVGRVRDVTQQLRRHEIAVGTAAPGDTGVLVDLRNDIADLRRFTDSVRRYHLQAFADQMALTASTLEVEGPAELRAVAQRKTDAADSISTHRIDPALTALDRALDAASRSIGSSAERHAMQADVASSDANLKAIWLLVAAVAGALAVSIWVTRTVSGAVSALERGFAAVAAGDFEHTLGVTASERDEFGRLAGSFGQMAAKLAELDKLKATFVSVASHELKTPINVMLGYLTLLTDGIYGPTPEAQRSVLQTIERQARTLARLVQHLLDVSRFEAGVARLELRPVALRGILVEAEQSHAVLAQQRGVSFRAEFAEELPDVVTWDADRVREVLDNLLSNAVKFTPAGGTVELDATPDRRRHPPSVQLTVRDTGVGIPAEQLGRVFDKFYQADNQGGASAKGSGLGLAISKEIVEAHGGSITVDSTPGVRTEFVVTLPITAHDGATLVTSSANADDGASDAEPTARAEFAETAP